MYWCEWLLYHNTERSSEAAPTVMRFFSWLVMITVCSLTSGKSVLMPIKFGCQVESIVC